MIRPPPPTSYFDDPAIIDRPAGDSTPVAQPQPNSGAAEIEFPDGPKLEKVRDFEEDSDSGESIQIEPGIGSRVKLTIPGTSKSVTVNFTAEVLNQVMASMEYFTA